VREQSVVVPRIRAGLFAASDWLGFGFVQGAPRIYLEELSSAALDRLGLSIKGTGVSRTRLLIDPGI
jgi:hypothetical protein